MRKRKLEKVEDSKDESPEESTDESKETLVTSKGKKHEKPKKKSTPTKKSSPTTKSSPKPEQHLPQSSEPLPKIDAPGILALAKRNKKYRFFLPTKENFFGGLKFETVMIDNGCNSLLLPLQSSNDLDELCKLFPKPHFIWEIGKSNGVAAKSLALVIRTNYSEIKISLCTDLIEKKNQIDLLTDVLRFHLCTEDLQTLTSRNDLLQPNQIQSISDFLATHGHHVDRRKHALLGQTILSNNNILSIQAIDVFAILDARRYDISSMDSIRKLNEFITTVTPVVENFDDLEDDHHEGDDEELYHLSPDDFIDE